MCVASINFISRRITLNPCHLSYTIELQWPLRTVMTIISAKFTDKLDRIGPTSFKFPLCAPKKPCILKHTTILLTRCRQNHSQLTVKILKKRTETHKIYNKKRTYVQVYATSQYLHPEIHNACIQFS